MKPLFSLSYREIGMVKINQKQKSDYFSKLFVFYNYFLKPVWPGKYGPIFKLSVANTNRHLFMFIHNISFLIFIFQISPAFNSWLLTGSTKTGWWEGIKEKGAGVQIEWVRGGGGGGKTKILPLPKTIARRAKEGVDRLTRIYSPPLTLVCCWQRSY